MFAFATKFDQISLINLIGHLLQRDPPQIKEIRELVQMISVKMIPRDIGLRLAAVLSEHANVDLAFSLMESIDVWEYAEHADNVGKVNLLISTLISVGRGDDALCLLKSNSFKEKFGMLDDMVIRLRAVSQFLSHNHVESAEVTAGGVDPYRFIKHTRHASQVMFFLEAMVLFPEPDKLLQHLETSTIIGRIATETYTNRKLELVNRLIMQARPNAARQLLSGIDLDGITRKTQFESLILSLIHLSQFDEAEYAFKDAIHKRVDCSDLRTCMAAMALRRGKPNMASEYIDGFAAHAVQRTASSMLWKAKIHNYTGNHSRALYWADRLLSDYGDVPVYRCFGLVEKGNTRRAKGWIEEALGCYQDARSVKIGPVFWLWIACFEQAMTLFHLGDQIAALKTARKGCQLNSYPYKDVYNPCHVLYRFLLYHQNQSSECFISPEKWFDSANFWPFTYLPYKIWMFLLIVASLEKRKQEVNIPKRCSEKMDDLNLEDMLYRGDDCCSLLYHGLFCGHQFVETLSSTAWPNDHNWQIFKALF